MATGFNERCTHTCTKLQVLLSVPPPPPAPLWLRRLLPLWNNQTLAGMVAGVSAADVSTTHAPPQPLKIIYWQLCKSSSGAYPNMTNTNQHIGTRVPDLFSKTVHWDGTHGCSVLPSLTHTHAHAHTHMLALVTRMAECSTGDPTGDSSALQEAAAKLWMWLRTHSCHGTLALSSALHNNKRTNITGLALFNL